jgi:Patatin phospholipase
VGTKGGTKPGNVGAVARGSADRKVYNIIHFIYRAKSYEGHCKDSEFARLPWKSIGASDITVLAAPCDMARCPPND